jgi:NADH-quinone oxidoreductase subunit G
VGIGSPRASLEANFALKRLVGDERFFLGLADREHTLVERAREILTTGPSPAPTLRDIDAADLVLVLGEDLTNTAPMLALSLRRWDRVRPTQAEERLGIARWNDAGLGMVKKEEPSALWIADTHAGKLDEAAAAAWHAAPADLARFALALARAVGGRGAAPVVKPADAAERAAVERFGAALRGARRPLVVSGVSAGSLELLEAAARLAHLLPAWRAGDGDVEGAPRGAGCPLALVLPEANTLGLALLGGRRLSEAFDLAAAGDVEVALIVENDLYRRAPAARVDAFLAHCPTVLVVDHVTTPTTARATAVMPAASWAESTGTWVGFEGRAQRSFQVMVPGRSVQPTWRWLSGLATAARLPVGQRWYTVDDVLDELARERPDLAPAALAAPPAGTRFVDAKVPRQPHRYSGRTAMVADRTVHEPPPPDDRDAPLAFSMEGYGGQAPAALVARYRAPRWNSVQALNKFQEEVAGPLRGGDAGARLVEPPPTPQAAPAPAVPARFAPVPDRFLAVPLHEIYGTDELSMLSPPIAGRAPAPYLALGALDAERLGLQHGDGVRVTLPPDGPLETRLSLPLRLVPSLPAGLCGLPVGLPLLPFVDLPGEVVVEPREAPGA